MNKIEKIRLATILLIALTFAITFSLYRQDAKTQEVSVSFGKIVSLNVGGDGETKTIGPENAEATVNVTLSTKKVNDDNSTDLYTYGKFYVEIVQEGEPDYKLSEEIVVSLTFDEKTYSHDKIVKNGDIVPKGFISKLSENPIAVKLTYSLTDEGKNNFIRYAEQQVQLILHWDYCEAPTVTVHVVSPPSGGSGTVYYQVTESSTTSDVKELKFTSSVEVKDFAISPSTTAIRFSKTDSGLSNSLDLDFSDLKFADSSKKVSLEDVSEIWVTLEEEPKVYSSEPSE